MSKYRIYGDICQQYYIDVEAETLDSAYEIADSAQRHEWFQVESDDVIESYKHDILDLLEDGYPNMANDIIISDKSDN